jgi:hypothetical protein
MFSGLNPMESKHILFRVSIPYFLTSYLSSFASFFLVSFFLHSFLLSSFHIFIFLSIFLSFPITSLHFLSCISLTLTPSQSLFELYRTGDFWHVRGALCVDLLNRVLASLKQWTQPVIMIPGNHDQVRGEECSVWSKRRA